MKKKIEEDEKLFMNVKSFANRWDVCTKTVRTWLNAGLPHIRLGYGEGSTVKSDAHRRIRINVKKADAWVKQTSS